MYLTELSDEDLSALLLIRHFERALLRLFEQGRLPGTTHTCLGQEHVPVALAPLLAGDHVFSNHRGHGHYLARYDDPEGLLAEIMGREGAVCAGVGGSQHIRRAGYLSTGVQGQLLPVAAGVALHLRDSGQHRAAVAFIGDGTWGEGVVYETLNLARLWALPLLVVVENNGIAQSTETAAHLAGTVAGRAAAFGISHLLVETDDINEIRAAVAPVVARVRQRAEPVVVEFLVHRLGPHSKGDDTRPPEVLARLGAADWYVRYASRFPEQFERVEAKQAQRIADVVGTVGARPPSRWAGVPS